jgi:hypothetical protein
LDIRPFRAIMPPLMKHYSISLKDNLAARVALLLAAILMTACNATPTSDPVVVGVTSGPGDMPIPTSASTNTPSPKTPTPTLATRPTFTPTSLSPDDVSSGDTTTPTPTQTPPPTDTPTPKPTASSGMKISATDGEVKVYETTITLPTYPIRDYLTEQVDPVYNIPVYYFERQAFESDQPTPTPTDYTGVVLENPYLRLTFLPELGGRLYSAVVKSTGQEIFYHNQVVKPSRYGILEPYEANWWLATGGMDWAYPTQEHGYRFGVPWDYEVTQTNEGATITLSDIAPDRVGVEVQITLSADSAVFTVKPKLTNATDDTVPVQFWLNAALALAPDTMSPNTQFIVPTDKITVHSRGENGWDVPGELEESSWPRVGKTDLSDYGQWANYLGFFVPNMEAPFMGAYNPDTNLGVVRLVEPSTVPGNKLFAFGPAFPDRSYTDDDSQYFEIWGGANTGFWPEDDISVPAGGTLQWQESWWPLAELGGITWANEHAAIHLRQSSDTYHLSLLVSRPQQGKLIVSAGETTILTESFSADPAIPLQLDFAISDTPVRVQIIDGNVTLLDYCTDCQEK